MRVQIPTKIYSNFIGFKYFINIFHKVENIDFEDVVFDFSDCEWFDANLCAVLGAIINHVTYNINNIELANLSQDLDSVFTKNEFLKHFGRSWILDDKYKTTIKYRRYKPTDQAAFVLYLEDELLSQKDMPQMSDLLGKKIQKSILELFDNAVLHGKSESVFSCGQCFPQANPPRLDFTVVDLGKTIKKNVNDYLRKELTGVETIEWAMQEANTTKSGRTPGGLGLKLIREFLGINKGKIQVVSADGFWEQRENSSIFTKDFQYKFPGTIVNLEILIDDTSYYSLVEEQKTLNEKDIF